MVERPPGAAVLRDVGRTPWPDQAPVDLGVRIDRLRSPVIRDFVDHVIPGEGFIHWPEVCAQHALTRYDQPLLLEVSMTHSAVKEPREFLRIAHRQGRQLAGQARSRASLS